MNRPSRNFLTREGHRPKKRQAASPRGYRMCPARGCARLMQARMMMCGQHWAKVPAALQSEVWQEYDAFLKRNATRPSPRYLELRQQALRFAEDSIQTRFTSDR